MRDENQRRYVEPRTRSYRMRDDVGSRPDRVALWAVFMAVIGMIAAAASAHAAPIDPGPSTPKVVAHAPAGDHLTPVDSASRLP